MSADTTGKLLDAVDGILSRYVAFPDEHARHAVAAWCLHAWTVRLFDNTPRLALLSPEKGSGKTRTLEVLQQLTPRAHHVANASTAVLFRLVGGDDPVTLLMDEADSYLGFHVAKDHEDLRGIINAGHRRGATVMRVAMEGKSAEIQTFPVFAPVALAGLGDLPDTIMDRSVVIEMKRRRADERIEQFRVRLVERETQNLREALEGWAQDPGTAAEIDAMLEAFDSIAGLMPSGIEDRAADVWEPLLVIGMLAGSPWETRIQQAAQMFVAGRAEAEPSLTIQLLRDIRGIFDDAAVERMSSRDLAAALADIEGSPWSSIRGMPLDANGLARRLRAHRISPVMMRDGEQTHRGYSREMFVEAWSRYLPSVPSPETRNTRNTRNTDPQQAIQQPPFPQDVTAVAAVTPSEEGEDEADHDPQAGPIALDEIFTDDPFSITATRP